MKKMNLRGRVTSTVALAYAARRRKRIKQLLVRVNAGNGMDIEMIPGVWHRALNRVEEHFLDGSIVISYFLGGYDDAE